MIRRSPSVVVAVAVWAAGGCALSHVGSAVDASEPTDAGHVLPRLDGGPPDFGLDAGLDASSSPLPFTRCSAAFDPMLTVDCANVMVPLDWSDPHGRQISLYVERVPAPSGHATTQLWMLNGGPGAASTPFSYDAAAIQALLPDVEIYSTDHRGTGLSTRLGCPASGESPASAAGTTLTDAELRPCIAEALATWGAAGFAQFSTTSAARDLGELVGRARVPGVRTIVYGVSYGTYWVHRYLQIFPSQPDAAVLDSICSPGACQLPIGFTRGHDDVIRALLQACADDPSCGAHFTGAPADTLAAGLARLDAGTCPAAVGAGLGSAETRQFLAVMLEDGVLRNAIPGLALRLSRCDATDTAAIESLATILHAPRSDGDMVSLLFDAPLLYGVVARSELWDVPEPTEVDYHAAMTTLLVAAPFQPDDFPAWDAFPRYPRDGYYGAFAPTTIPLLMMNGTFDPQTTMALAQPTGDHFRGPGQTFVVFDRAVHGALFVTTPDGSQTMDYRTCGMDVMRQFIASPTAPLDTSCRTTTSAFSFDDSALAMMLFGTPSMWSVDVRGPSPRLVDARRVDALRRRLDELLRRGPRLVSGGGSRLRPYE